MIFITLCALLIASILVFISEQLSLQKSKILYVFFGIFLCIIAGFRNGENMPDYETYKGFYDAIVSGYFSYFIEISFIYIAKLSNLIINENSIVLFVIYAILGVSLKLYSIWNLSDLYFYSLIIYISNYFILQEMIQIRAGIATALILLSIVPLYNRNIKYFLLIIVCATLFHYSSIIFLLLWFLKPIKYNKILYFSLIVIAYLIHFSWIDIIGLISDFIPFNDIVLKFESYTDETRTELLKINVFGLFALTRIVILIYFTFFVNLIERHNKYIFILLKCYAIGIFIYIALSQYPDIAVRISYTLMASDILIIPTLIYTIKGHYLPRLIVVIYGLLVFLLNVYFTSYFNWQPNL
jgi:hypothetical protein